MMNPLMKCGHAANATSRGKPVCVICYGIDEGAAVIDESPPDLAGRKAKCTYCKREKDSSLELPFFEYGEGKWKHDWYYCGCRGWD